MEKIHKHRYVIHILVGLFLAWGIAGCHHQTLPANDSQSVQEMVQNDIQHKRMQSRIAWLLLEAEDAFKERRLTTPKTDNALNYYQEVLTQQPDNIEAQLGIERIVKRYKNMIRYAVEKKRLAKAQILLLRAQSVDENHKSLQNLENEIMSLQSKEKLQFFLDTDLLQARSPVIVHHLESIRKYLANNVQEVLLVSPTDADSQWILKQLAINADEQQFIVQQQAGKRSKVQIKLSSSDD
ncbi:hypothetical protein [Zooshikella sp. RANM57]|uniref:hypothetical protein n=1 Tax=Zooshikella sp. RANM57 TaxID=3425863 RepID=UPI003D6E652D